MIAAGVREERTIDAALLPHPMPFDPHRSALRIPLRPESNGTARLVIHDVSGAEIVSKSVSGESAFIWDGRGADGLHVVDGTYLYIITTEGHAPVSGMLVVQSAP